MSEKLKECTYICGIDEVGRGPVAGPVTIGLVLYRKKDAHIFSHIPLKDSKSLSPQRRRAIFDELRQFKKEGKIFFTTASVPAKTIDSSGISHAIKKAIKKVLFRIPSSPIDTSVFLDGGLSAGERFPVQTTIIKGDTKHRAIALASIVAKVTRDNHMELQDEDFPGYNFAGHKGYGTKEHYKAIKRLGFSSIHRKSFLKNL